MTRKDYVLIADTLSVLQEQADVDRDMLSDEQLRRRQAWSGGVRDSARALAKVLAADNPRFDRERFLKACGVTQ